MSYLPLPSFSFKNFLQLVEFNSSIQQLYLPYLAAK